MGGHLKRAVAVLLAFSTAGCTTMIHQLGWIDWWNESVQTEQKTETLEISSEPAGARVTRSDKSGALVEVGTTPLRDPIPLSVQTKVESPKTGGLWLGAGIELALGIGLTVGGVSAGSSSANKASTGATGATGATTSSSKGSLVGLSITGSLLATASLIDVLAALIHGSLEDRRTPSSVPTELSYTARLPGLPDAEARAVVPGQSKLHLVLGGTPTAPSWASASPSSVRTDSRWVVAVMSTEGSELARDPTLQANLSDQIRIFVAQQGIRTIDRGAQESALKQQISGMKSESYKTCYDASCQIELGKALAASHILRTRITRFGQKCVLNGELIDLKSEVTVAAASSQGVCEAEGYLQMGAAVAQELGSGR